MPLKKLKDLLDSHNIYYEVISHPTEVSAMRVAQSAHIPGSILAKTVVVKIDDRMVMLVIPASKSVDWDILMQECHTTNVKMATESEFQGKFPKCEIGAIPPVGSCFGMEVYISQEFDGIEDIAINAGNHHEVILLKYKDFCDIVKPTKLKLVA